MNADVKKLWIEDLRSGLHEQGKKKLRTQSEDGTTYDCCLGRLCDLYSQAHPDQTDMVWKKPKGEPGTILESRKIIPFGPYMEIHILPEPVIRWAGLDSPDPTVSINPNGRSSLSVQNDGGATFKEIADLIEGHL